MACSKAYIPESREESHKHNMEKLCVMCTKKSGGYVMSEKHKKLFDKYVYTHKDYFEDAWLLPSGLCEACRLRLEAQDDEKKKLIRKLKPKPPYEAILKHVRKELSGPVLRSQGDAPLHCPCGMCKRSLTIGMYLYLNSYLVHMVFKNHRKSRINIWSETSYRCILSESSLKMLKWG